MSDPALTGETAPALAVLDRLRAKRQAALPSHIPRTPRGRPSYPLSYGQEQLWFIDQMEPGNAGNTAYNITAALELAGPLDPAALASALAEVVRRHETLRTTFRSTAAEPVQVIAPAEPAAGFPLRLVDLAGIARPAVDRAVEQEIERLARLEGRIPFDLTRGPLLRVALLRLGPEDHLLLFATHHIVSDGWSMRVLLRETRLLYQAFRERRLSPLPDLPVQYVDFVEWQRRWLDSERAARQLAYWQRQLGTELPVLQLPADRPRPAVQSSRGAVHYLVLPGHLTRAVNALQRQAGATPFVILLAAFQTLLHRLSGQREILVGTPIANRQRTEIQDLIGLFVNTLVLRAELPAGGSFLELLSRLSQAALGAFENQELPFGRVVAAVQPERALSHTPIFQASFSYQNMEAPRWGLAGLELTVRNFARDSSMFDFSLSFREDPGEEGLAGEIEYGTDLFDASTVARYAGQLEVLIAGIVADPERRIADLPLLAASERQQVLYEWATGPQVSAAGETTVHALFEAQAARTPDAIAVVAQEEALSYRELDASADRVARLLARRGVGPEVRVALHLERNVHLLVGLFGILKAGGTYVPVDPAYPAARKRLLFDDAGAPVVVTQTSLARELQLDGVAVLCLDEEAIHRQPAGCLNRRPTPGNPAYLIYTSGSTGKPKGVAIEHRSIATYAVTAAAEFALAPGDRMLQFSSISFDTFGEEIYPSLARGATLVLRNGEMLASVADFFRTAERWEITLFDLPTAYWHEICAALPRERLALPPVSPVSQVSPVPPALRLVIIAGEQALRDRLEAWRQAAISAEGRAPVPVMNTYGPTEATIVGTWCELCRATAGSNPDLQAPIGRPIPGATAHVLDRDLAPLPIGAVGELLLGGVGIARGYHERPDGTALRFVPHPFAERPGARLYRTGDLARHRADGTLEFLGRVDEQVKVRGFRIELAEIESALREHPGVAEGVILAPVEASGSRRLVAYVVAESGAAPTVAGLRQHLAERLPDYMVPTSWRFLAALPLTPNGKIDRQALPTIAASAGSVEEEAGAARESRAATPVEEVVAGIWEEVLGRERVHPDDNFFEIGGHSLLASQVVSRAREVFGVDLALRSFFGAPTVAALARVVEDAVRSGGQGRTLAPPLVARLRQEAEPLSFGQQRFWFLHQLDPGSTAYQIPAVLHLAGALSPAALEAALAGVAARHEALRTTFALLAAGPVQVIAPPAGWRLPAVDLAGVSPPRRTAEMERLAVAEANRPFDLGRGPLLRTVFLRLDGAEHVLLLVLHHIVADAWSMAILWREVVALYRAVTDTECRPDGLPALPLQYRDYAAWQREWLSGEVLAGELAWWRRQLAGAPTLLELPTDRPRPPLQRFRGGRLEWSLPAAPAHRLLALGRREGATLFMVALAVFDVLLGRSSRQEDVVVGFPIAGRTHPALEGLIGLFLNTLALRVAVSPEVSFRDLLRQVREVTLAAYAHQEVPFEKLVGELDLERSLAHAPLFQVLLVLQNAPAAVAEMTELPGLAVRALDVEMGTAKFDLVFNLEETAAGLSGWWLYNSDLFDATTVRRIAGQFTELVAGTLADPDRRLADLPLLGPAERHQLLAEWNDSAFALPGARTFPQLFRAQVRRSPAALAVACGEVELTYAELDARAGRLARGLVAAGVGPEVVVAVLAERGIDLLVALLAIGKAGGAYLPLDPHHPIPRLRQTLEQSAARLVLVGPLFVEAGAELGGAGAPGGERRVLPLSELLSEEGPAEPLPDRALPDNLAYVIFTSGSTGVPKGAMLEQRGMVNHLATKILTLGITATDRVAQTALQTFDISIWQLLAALLVGGSVDILPDELVRDPLRLLSEIERRGITLFETVPSLLAALLQVDPEHRPRLERLRWLIPTGEALPPELSRQWFAAYPAIPLLNAYGPTECSDDVSVQVLREALPAGTPRTPIGRPVANTRVYLLGPGGEPAPIGVPGELAVGGVQVGRGYGGRPELTADRFVPDPFAGEPGERLYRTGDLARVRPSGELEFLGRIDHQVKVRGFRIELGDIEAALADHPDVREVVVLAREDQKSPGGEVDRRLVAYLTAEEERAPAASDLRAFLHTRLPEYMVPAAFVVLPALPLTPNGKVDRKALPAPEGSGAGPQGFVAPQTDLERALARLWEEVLGMAPGGVGIHDPFFDIGGNSILGAVLINRLQKILGEIVHVVALFDHPTVAGLAAYLLADYPEAVARIWGLVAERPGAAAAPIDAARVAQLFALVPPRRPAERTAPKNRRAVFLLSAPRSGSTLLRVMLAGHPRLFAPPELELLSFDDMAQRKAAFAGRNSFWLEGLIRALMEIHGSRPEEATALVERAEAEALPTRELYRRIEEWIGNRLLVDKGSAYSLSPGTLERAEAEFNGALYIHLIRDPRAMIHSFIEAKLDQVFFPHAHPFTRRELAELIWVVSHQNIVRFLAGIPEERQRWVRFEELVRDPRAVLTGICDLLGLPFHPDIVDPYSNVESRMTDGLHAESRMLGDPKFLAHRTVDAGAAERWREGTADLPLGEPTHELAATLGYATREDAASAPGAPAPLAPPARSHPALVPLVAEGDRPPLFLVHPIGGGVFWYLALARQLGDGRPVYGLRSLPPPLDSGPADLRAMARGYLDAVRQVQRTGPYVLGGWSMGAVVAYEMARQLHAAHAADIADTAGESVARLVLIDPPPPLAASQGEDDEITLLAALAGDLEGLSGESLGMTLADLARLAPEERLPRMLEVCQRKGALPAEIDLAQFRELFTMFRQNRNALKTYVPEPYPGGLSLFLAGADPGEADPALAWRELAAGGTEVYRLAGDHYSILRAPAVEAFAETLRRDLASLMMPR
jgi:amino acid adenylation domain-containing protein